MRQILFKQDGNQICAYYEDFEDLQNSPAGFGDTAELAVLDLFTKEKP